MDGKGTCDARGCEGILTLSQLSDSSVDFIGVFLADGTVLHLNPTACRELGVAPEEARGRLIQALAPGRADELLRRGERVVAEGCRLEAEERTTSGDDTRWFASVYSPLQAEHGATVGFILQAREITHHKRTENDLRNRLSELATRNRELEERPRGAQKMELVGRLAAGVAHDLNNMLTVITTYAGLLAEELRDHPLAADVEEISESAKRAATVARQLLSFSRRQLVEPQLVNVNTVVGTMAKLLHRIVGEHIDLRVSLGEEMGDVHVDPAQLEQVLVELVMTAANALPRGGSLAVCTEDLTVTEEQTFGRTRLGPGRYAAISVRDTGPSIPQANRERALEPCDATGEDARRAELSLARVRSIVEESSGRIEVTGAPDTGTAVAVYLPCATPEAVAESHPADNTDLRGSETVLIVDDDAPVQRVIRHILTSAGYSVLTADNGAEALCIYMERETEIDLVLTDVVMPEMGGQELAELLAASRGRTKVAFISGYPGDTIARLGPLDPSAPFLAKPFDAARLLTYVRRALDGH